MKQLSLFPSMQDESILTAEQLKEQFFVMPKGLIDIAMKERFYVLRDAGRLIDARAIAAEFVVR